MSSLRPSLIRPSYLPDYKNDLGLFLFCFCIAAWLHLVGFIAWQVWESKGSQELDLFYFDFTLEQPVLELTLFMEGQDLGPGAGTEEKEGAEEKEPTSKPTEPPKEVEEPEATAAAPEPDLPSPAATEQEFTSELDLGINITAAPQPAARSEGTAPKPLTPQTIPQIIDQNLAQAELLPFAEGSGIGEPDSSLVVEAEAPKFKSYYTVLRRAVAVLWILSPEARAQFRPSQLVADFTVSSQGELLSIVIIQSTGNASLDHAGLEAIRSATPFPPFPPELQNYNQLAIRMQFNYKAGYKIPKS